MKILPGILTGWCMTKFRNLSQGRALFSRSPVRRLMPEGCVETRCNRTGPQYLCRRVCVIMICPPLMEDLRRIAGTQHHVAMYLATATPLGRPRLKQCRGPRDKGAGAGNRAIWEFGWAMPPQAWRGSGGHGFRLQSAMDIDQIAEAARGATQPTRSKVAAPRVMWIPSTSLVNYIAGPARSLDLQITPRA